MKTTMMFRRTIANPRRTTLALGDISQTLEVPALPEGRERYLQEEGAEESGTLLRRPVPHPSRRRDPLEDGDAPLFMAANPRRTVVLTVPGAAPEASETAEVPEIPEVGEFPEVTAAPVARVDAAHAPLDAAPMPLDAEQAGRGERAMDVERGAEVERGAAAAGDMVEELVH